MKLTPCCPNKIDVVNVDSDLLGKVRLGGSEDSDRHAQPDVTGPGHQEEG